MLDVEKNSCDILIGYILIKILFWIIFIKKIIAIVDCTTKLMKMLDVQENPSDVSDFFQTSRSRSLTQRLNYERFMHSQKQKNLQREKQVIKDEIEREEKDMVKQLMRLEEERKNLHRDDDEVIGESLRNNTIYKLISL